MRARTIILLVGVILVAAFAALNWAAFMTPMPLSLGFTSVVAPLGIVMLALLVAVVLLFATYMAFWRGAMLVDARRHAKDLQAQRLLAEQAEASRVVDLQRTLKDDLERLGSRFDESRQALRQELRESINSLAAMLGEIDDRTRRAGGPGG